MNGKLKPALVVIFCTSCCVLPHYQTVLLHFMVTSLSSDTCTMSGNSNESIEHLFLCCSVSWNLFRLFTISSKFWVFWNTLEELLLTGFVCLGKSKGDKVFISQKMEADVVEMCSLALIWNSISLSCGALPKKFLRGIFQGEMQRYLRNLVV